MDIQSFRIEVPTLVATLVARWPLVDGDLPVAGIRGDV